MVDESGGIGIAADDRLLVRLLDPIERGKGRARKIIDQKTIRSWYEKNAVRRARRVAIAAHDEIPVVITEQDRAGRADRINRCVNGAVASAPVPMSQSVTAYVITDCIPLLGITDPEKSPTLLIPSTIVNVGSMS